VDRISRALGKSVVSAEPLSGGCISDARRVQTADGRVYFCKQSSKSTNLFLEEAQGLKALANTDTIRCPQTVFADGHLLILEWLEPETPTPAFWRAFGERLAALHRVPQASFGFAIDNHIGSTPQKNPLRAPAEISWCDYFLEYRLRPMFSDPTVAVDSLVQALFLKAESRIRAELENVEEAPSLVHGDLWGGNFLCTKGQIPVLIDPAPYCGHREADLAMSQLFGGFDSEFYTAYQRSFPLTGGFEVRKRIYNLYHILNHWILFGTSYREQACALLRSL
jgi:protein-ribulosamine 3-kinase